MSKYQSIRLDEALDQSPKLDAAENPGILIRAGGEVTVDSATNEALIAFNDEGGWAELKQNEQGQWELTIFKGAQGSGSVFLGRQVLGDPTSEIAQYQTYWKRDHEASVTELAAAIGLPLVGETNEDEQSRLIKDFRREYQRMQSFARYQIIYSTLVQRVPFLALISAGGMLPFEAEGFLHGIPFYFRYRGGLAKLSVGGNLLTSSLYSSAIRIGDEFDGSMGNEKFQDVFLLLLKRLKRAPVLWSFRGIKKGGEATERLGWGHNQEEGWESMVANLNSHMRLYEPGVNTQVFLESLGLSRESSTVDDRVFPDPEPVFLPL